MRELPFESWRLLQCWTDAGHGQGLARGGIFGEFLAGVGRPSGRSFTGTLMLTAECRALARLLPMGRSEATPLLPGSG